LGAGPPILFRFFGSQTIGNALGHRSKFRRGHETPREDVLKSDQSPQCCGVSDARISDVVRAFEREVGNLIPILHALQKEFGYLSPEAMEEAASWLAIPASEVYGTATFYTLFSTVPVGTHMVRICDSTPCHIEGAKAIEKAIEADLGVSAGGTTEDGVFTFQVVSCFGLCGVAPAIMIDEDVYGNLTPEMIPGILSKYRKEAC
jgi:NADH:ubiquinone oxidoreductase subunit E